MLARAPQNSSASVLAGTLGRALCVAAAHVDGSGRPTPASTGWAAGGWARSSCRMVAATASCRSSTSASCWHSASSAACFGAARLGGVRRVLTVAQLGVEGVALGVPLLEPLLGLAHPHRPRSARRARAPSRSRTVGTCCRSVQAAPPSRPRSPRRARCCACARRARPRVRAARLLRRRLLERRALGVTAVACCFAWRAPPTTWRARARSAPLPPPPPRAPPPLGGRRAASASCARVRRGAQSPVGGR